MEPLSSIVVLGFFLGMRHATDPDHVVAVSTFVTRHKSVSRSLWIGFFWGMGHTVTVVMVGSSLVLLGIELPVRLGLSLEFSVGLMLVVLGWLNLRGFLDWLKTVTTANAEVEGSTLSHSHAHAHGDYIHTHEHRHEPERHPHASDKTPVSWMDRNLGGMAPYQWARPLFVGVVHGMAGSSTVALLVLAAIRQARWAIAYLLVFGAGTILGMLLVTLAIAYPLVLGQGRFSKWSNVFRFASGAVSLAFGLFIVYRMGSALLSAMPPR